MMNTLQPKIEILTGIFLVFLSFNCIANDNPQITKNNSDTTQVNHLIGEAKLHFFSNLMKTQELALSALQISEQLEYPKGKAYSNFYLAQVYLDYNFKQAEKFLIESLIYAKEINDSTLINSINNSFGIVYQNAGEHQKALQYFHKVLNSYLLNGKDSLAAAIYNNLAISYEELDYDSIAMDNYQRAIQINERNGNLEWLARNYQNLGNYYLKHHQPEAADRQLAKSLEIAQRNNDEQLKPYLLYNLYESAAQKNDPVSAMKLARLTLQKAREQMIILKERDALKAIVDFYEKRNNTDSAWFYLKALQTVSDSLNKTNHINEIYALDLQNKLEEQRLNAETELKILQIEKSRKELIYLIAILISVIALAISGRFIYRLRMKLHNRKKEHETTQIEKGELENRLEYKDREFTTQLIYQQKRNEYLNQVAAKLQKVADNNPPATKQLQTVINDLHKSTQQDIWPEFDLRFKEIHSDFYKNLTTRFPNLTPNEIKLCAFLKLNMSTKEIADLTSQNPDSLKIARHRLRTKLNLSRTDNIVNFLNQL